jgi:acetylornithine deacetylase/succinyl-diaminopimelate desuccinylase-like protein
MIMVICVTTSPLAAQVATSDRARHVADDVRVLAADSLQGRKTCQPGNDTAARYLAGQLRRLGARPAGDSGTYLQHWVPGNTSGNRESGIVGCTTANVIATIPGRGALAGQVLIFGAHFDHLGTGRFGSLAPDSGQVHNGADDNASGTAAVLEMARVLQRDRSLRDARPRRTLVFALWSGEEEGSLGSAYYAGHLPMPKDSVTAYLNFDMVGRLRDGKLLALGVRTATEWPALLDSANAAAHLDVRASGDGWGPSDHASFTAQKIPVLHFFTDLHEDYHRPSDDADKINADGIVAVADLAAELTRRLDRMSGPLTYVDVPPPAQAAAGSSDRPRPSLGTIPDMSEEPGGVRISGVRTGSAAEAAGMRAGDVLIGIGSATIANLQDFQNALVQHAAGDRVEIRYRRGDQVIAVMVTLGARAN